MVENVIQYTNDNIPTQYVILVNSGIYSDKTIGPNTVIFWSGHSKLSNPAFNLISTLTSNVA